MASFLSRTVPITFSKLILPKKEKMDKFNIFTKTTHFPFGKCQFCDFHKIDVFSLKRLVFYLERHQTNVFRLFWLDRKYQELSKFSRKPRTTPLRKMSVFRLS